LNSRNILNPVLGELLRIKDFGDEAHRSKLRGIKAQFNEAKQHSLFEVRRIATSFYRGVAESEDRSSFHRAEEFSGEGE